VVAPLLFEKEVLGALSLESSAKSAFTADDQRVLVSFAATATAAIRNAQLHAEVQKLAITDALTGLYNRRGLFELGRHEVERTRRFGHPLSAIWIDVDNFKHINDTFGHAAGDQLLSKMGQVLRNSFRGTVFVARWGGDEFVVMLPEADHTGAEMAAAKLISALKAEQLKFGSEVMQMSASIGIALLPGDTDNVDELMRFADRAMYAAKRAGGNRWYRHGRVPPEDANANAS